MTPREKAIEAMREGIKKMPSVWTTGTLGEFFQCCRHLPGGGVEVISTHASEEGARAAQYRHVEALRATAALDALLAALPGMGLKVVPVRATAEMLVAAQNMPMTGIVHGTILFRTIQRHNKRYAAMLAAAPNPLEAPHG